MTINREFLIPADQAAKKYGIARSTIFLYLRLRRIRRFHINGDRRTHVDWRELERFFEPTVV